MLLQAETTLHDLNTKFVAQTKQAALAFIHAETISQLQEQLKIERTETASLRLAMNGLQQKLAKAVDEKETYINQLIQSKTAQASILDEANRVHNQAVKKLAELELKQKAYDEQRAQGIQEMPTGSFIAQ